MSFKPTQEQKRKYEHEAKVDRMKKSDSIELNNYRENRSNIDFVADMFDLHWTEVTPEEVELVIEVTKRLISHEEMIEASLEEMSL